MAQVYPGLDDYVAHLPEVKAEIRAATEPIGARAKALLAGHTDTGDARIEVTYGRTDGVVSLVDKAAVPIEFGYTAENGTPVKGLNILGRAAGL